MNFSILLFPIAIVIFSLCLLVYLFYIIGAFIYLIKFKLESNLKLADIYNVKSNYFRNESLKYLHLMIIFFVSYISIYAFSLVLNYIYNWFIQNSNINIVPDSKNKIIKRRKNERTIWKRKWSY